MSDRLSELLRQRALLQDHLAWLDRQIAEASAASRGAPPLTRPAPPAAVTPPASHPATAAVLTATLNRVPAPVVGSPAPAHPSAVSEEEYRVEVKNIERDVRKGCVLYFVAALLFLSVVVLALYYTISSR
jgi:uncharacterized membrane protein